MVGLGGDRFASGAFVLRGHSRSKQYAVTSMTFGLWRECTWRSDVFRSGAGSHGLMIFLWFMCHQFMNKLTNMSYVDVCIYWFYMKLLKL